MYLKGSELEKKKMKQIYLKGPVLKGKKKEKTINFHPRPVCTETHLQL